MRARPFAIILTMLLASPASAAAPPLIPGETPAFNDWLRFVRLRLVQSAVRSHDFPHSARVVVTLFVHPDGSVDDVHAISSSDPNPRFPALAARVVAAAGPFPPIPPSTNHGDGARIDVPLAFHWSPPPRRHRQ